MNRIAIAMLAVFVVGCSKAAEDITPTYVSPVQYSNYDCDQTRNELIRVNAQANKLGGKLDEDAETDEGVTAAGIILFWPALFFLGGTKGQEAEYARLRGEYNALEQSEIQKKCDLPEPKTLTSRSEGSSIEASKITAARDSSQQQSTKLVSVSGDAAPDTARLLSDWRLRTDILRKALRTEWAKTGSFGGWVFSEFKIVSAGADEKDPKLVTLATEYTLEPVLGWNRHQLVAQTYRRSMVVNSIKDEVVKTGEAQQVK